MPQNILTFCLITILTINATAQDVFFKTGKNRTTYNYMNANGLSPIKLSPQIGNTNEIGIGFPFSMNIKKKKNLKEETKTQPLRFRNEVAFMLNSYNAYGGDPNNNYSYETTFGGLNNQFSLLGKIGNLEFGILGIIGINKIITGTQVINNGRYNLKLYDEFRRDFLSTGLGASAYYPLLDNVFLSFTYKHTQNKRPKMQETEHVNFNSRIVLFGLHFKMN
jgi:hypothetical protein